MPRSLREDWKASARPEKIVITVPLVFILLSLIVHLTSWARHDIPLRVEAVAVAMLSMLTVVIWHSWLVKGPKQTVAFFLLAWVTSWIFEFIGHNYGWYFGDYDYTNTLGPRLGGVPLLIVITWAVIIYASFMIIDWLFEIKGEVRAKTPLGRSLWATLIAASSATMVCAWDLMVDPFATSAVWKTAVGKEPWWWWKGGPYLRELSVWKGEGGVPIGNFVGWWVVPFLIVFVFYLFFQRENRVSGKLINAVPLTVYFFLYLTVVGVVLMMNWFENGFVQVALIGTFTMMPVVSVGIVKLARDYA